MRVPLSASSSAIIAISGKVQNIFLQEIRRSALASLFLIALIYSSGSQAQVKNYIYSTTTGNTLETGTFTTLLSTSLDDNVSATTNIGFNFGYGGVVYTTFSVTSNGLLRLGGAASNAYDNMMNTLTGPHLIPYWDDNYTDINGNVRYLLQGVAGSRKLVVEYNLSCVIATGTADKHFQVWLFESSNTIMFVYGTGNNTNEGFSTGILTNGSTDYISVNVATNASSTTVRQDNNTVWPGSGRAYTFIKSGTLPVSLLNFSGFSDGNKNQLQWATASEINNNGFEIQRSTDGINYSTIGFVNSQATGGNSSTVLQYNFTDYNVSGSKQQYRLRQVDIDNRSKLSSVILIDGSKAAIVQVSGLFPNPASTTVNVQIASPGRQELALAVTDYTGKIVLQQSLQVERGINIVPVDVSQLLNNTYLLQLTDTQGNRCEAVKLLVSRQ